MKKTLDIAIVLTMCSAFFVAAAAFRAFQIIYIALIGPSILYFLIGLALYAYYNQKKIVLPFFVATILWPISILLFWPPSPVIILVGITDMLILGNLSLGYYFNSLSKPTRYVAGIAMVGLVYYLASDYLPKRDVQLKMADYQPLICKSFNDFTANATLKDTSNSLVNNNFSKDTIYLFEFFFKRCTPCKMKEKILPRLAETFKDEAFKIVYVDNAEVDNFSSFTEGAMEKKYAQNLYDEKKILITNFNIKSFPLELIVDKKGIVRHTYSGYSFEEDSEYLKITTKKIKDLLNE